jgi:hypothetical protein
MLIERSPKRATNLLVAKRSSTETHKGESLWQQVSNPEVEKCGNNLTVRKVACCAEEDDHMRVGNALDAQSGAKWILRPSLCRRLSRLAAEPQFANCCVAFACLR